MAYEFSRMKTVRTAVAIVLLGAAPASAQSRAWTADVTAASYVEAWDFNDSTEHLTGVHAGLDRRIWREIAVRGEALFLHVHQRGEDAWVSGGMLLMRVRRGIRPGKFFAELGAGLAWATEPVPPNGTERNYVLLAGAGVEVPLSQMHLAVGARWLHFSNNGREGRARNPDIQSLGAFAGVGWRW
jgi:Lipid A 3-O-deacylase (PagL)